jgi:hypothetical protein
MSEYLFNLLLVLACMAMYEVFRSLLTDRD